MRKAKKPEVFADVTLDCLSSPVTGWMPVGTEGVYEYAWVDLVLGVVPQGKCGDSHPIAESDTPFGLTVWGTDWAVSYAYPAGAAVQPITPVVVPPTAAK